MLPAKTGKSFLKFRIAWEAKTVVSARKEVTYLVPRDLPKNIISMMFNRKKIEIVDLFFLKNRQIPKIAKIKTRGVNWKNDTLSVVKKFFIHKEKGKPKISGIESMKRLFEPNDAQNAF
jgi:hypothetical protein